uniref:Exocyst complex component 4 n=1 Tax=Zeugodacus cucurbitae TaxID=28588 RepID=A0A0A1XBF4_ZEUCU
MASSKSILVIAFCGLFALSMAHPLLEESALGDQDATVYLVDDQNWIEGDPSELLVRHVRSPSSSEDSSKEEKGRGRVELKYEETERGREGSFKYNHNLLKSDDDSYSIDAYAQGRRNYDWNQNDFQGGLEGRWNFKG